MKNLFNKVFQSHGVFINNNISLLIINFPVREFFDDESF